VLLFLVYKMTLRRSTRLTQKPRVDYGAMVNHGRGNVKKPAKAYVGALKAAPRVRCDTLLLMNFAFMTLIVM